MTATDLAAVHTTHTDNRAADNRAADNRAADNRAADNRAADNRAADNRAADNRAGGDPDQLIGVAAAELGEWGWLAGALLDWLAAATDDTVTDFHRFFAPSPTREHGLDQLHHLAERIDGLLEGNRGPR